MNDKNLTPVLVSGVSCYERDGTAYLKLEDVARGLGFTEKKGDVDYIMWRRIDKYLADFGFGTCAERPDYIPENVFYRLAMKAKNETAEQFQALVADEIIPSIRKTGSYSVAQIDPSLPPELAMVEGLLNSVKKLYMTQQEQTEELGKVKEQVNLMCEVNSTSVGDDWRTACTNAIRAVAFKRGGQTHYPEVWNTVYDKMKANGFDVRKRLDNRKKSAIATGMHPSYVRKLNALDVIADSKDKKLISAFISAVKEIAAAEGVKIAQKEDKPAAEQQYFDGMNDVEG